MKTTETKVDAQNEDEAMEQEGRAYAKEMGPAFCDQVREQLDALMTTYSDGEAQKAFDNLRELFWTRSWVEDENPQH